MISEAEKDRTVVGYKQTMKALGADDAEKVIIAEDCEERLKESIEAAAKKTGAEIIYADSMKTVGNMYGIDLGASCAGVLKK